MSTPPEILGYSIGAVLGSGGFATVYEAQGPAGPVALKVAHNSGDERIDRELAALDKVGPPAAPRLLDSGDRDGVRWIAMERVDGEVLSHQRHGGRARDIMLAICRSVAQAHEAGVVHRDLKPANLLVRGDGSVAVLDFGVATGDAVGALPSLTSTGMQLGTPMYMAPELWTDPRTADERTDIYALGVIGFELWTGRRPFGGDAATVRHAHIASRAPRPSDLAPVPAALDAIVARCLCKSQSDRYRSVAALAKDLTDMSEELAPAGGRPGARATIDSRETIVMAIDTAAPLAEVVAAGQAHGAVLALAPGQGPTVLAFPNSDRSAAVAAARHCARALGQVAGYTIDVQAVEFREGRRGSRVIGPGLGGIEVGSGESLSDAAAEWATRLAAIALRPQPSELIDVDLDSLVDAAHNGRPAVVLGGPGMGKSRVATDVARALRARGVACAYLRALAPERAQPDKLIARVLQLAFADEAAVEDAFAASESAELWAARKALGYPVAPHPMQDAPGAQRLALAGAVLRALDRGPRLVLDDAQWADPSLLDAIERGWNQGISTLIASTPEHAESRGGFAAARVGAVVELAPLPGDSAAQLAANLLGAVEFVSDAITARIAEESAGVPGAIVELAAALLATSVQRKPGERGLVIAGDAIPSAGGFGDKLAAQLIERVPTTLMPLLECSAVLDEVSVDDVESLIRTLGSEDDLAAIDPGYGLSRLSHLGVLERTGDTFAMRAPLVARALLLRISAARRRTLHRAALAYATDDLALARHASGAGEPDVAAAAHSRLGAAALAGHRYAEAERHFTAAIGHGAGRDALAGRGRVRYRLQRFESAVDDLRAARDGASGAERVELLLDEATCRDWCQDWKTSAELFAVAEAEADAVDELPPRLRFLVEVARARTLHRGERNLEALAVLDRAGTTDDYEAGVVANILGGAISIYADKLDRAAKFLNDAVQAATRTSDSFHLAASLTNRQVLSMKRQDVEQATSDLLTCVELGRKLANPQLERAARFNLGELLLWSGDFEQALSHAQRSRELQLSFVSAFAVPDDALLLARIGGQMGRSDDAATQLAWIDDHCDLGGAPATTIDLLSVARLLAADDSDDTQWSEVVDRLETSGLLEEKFEAMLSAAEICIRHGQHSNARRWLERAESAGIGNIWSARLTRAHSALEIDRDFAVD